MYSLVKKLEKRLLPKFEEIAEKIRGEIPNVVVQVYSAEIGLLTQFQGYGFCIDCTLTDVSLDKTDNVCLDVSLGYLTTNPRISAGVGWGHPSGHSEAEFRDWSGIFPDEGIIVTDEILEDLYKDLPRLYEVLFAALRRRRPSNEL